MKKVKAKKGLGEVTMEAMVVMVMVMMMMVDGSRSSTESGWSGRGLVV